MFSFCSCLFFENSCPKFYNFLLDFLFRNSWAMHWNKTHGDQQNLSTYHLSKFKIFEIFKMFTIKISNFCFFLACFSHNLILHTQNLENLENFDFLKTHLCEESQIFQFFSVVNSPRPVFSSRFLHNFFVSFSNRSKSKNHEAYYFGTIWWKKHDEVLEIL